MLTPQEFDVLMRDVFKEEEHLKDCGWPIGSFAYHVGIADINRIREEADPLIIDDIAALLADVLSPADTEASAVWAYEYGFWDRCEYSNCECCADTGLTDQQWAEKHGVGEYFHLARTFARELFGPDFAKGQS